MSKPSFKGEAQIGETLNMPFGNIDVLINEFGNYEVHLNINETSTVKNYRMDQRPDNTLYHLEVIIKQNGTVL